MKVFALMFTFGACGSVCVYVCMCVCMCVCVCMCMCVCTVQSVQYGLVLVQSQGRAGLRPNSLFGCQQNSPQSPV